MAWKVGCCDGSYEDEDGDEDEDIFAEDDDFWPVSVPQSDIVTL